MGQIYQHQIFLFLVLGVINGSDLLALKAPNHLEVGGGAAICVINGLDLSALKRPSHMGEGVT